MKKYVFPVLIALIAEFFVANLIAMSFNQIKINNYLKAGNYRSAVELFPYGADISSIVAEHAVAYCADEKSEDIEFDEITNAWYLFTTEKDLFDYEETFEEYYLEGNRRIVIVEANVISEGSSEPVYMLFEYFESKARSKEQNIYGEWYYGYDTSAEYYLLAAKCGDIDVLHGDDVELALAKATPLNDKAIDRINNLISSGEYISSPSYGEYC